MSSIVVRAAGDVEELFEGGDALVVHFGGEGDANVAEVPGFAAVAGRRGVFWCITEKEAVFISIGRYPFSARCIAEAISDITSAASRSTAQPVWCSL